jgi:DnaJ-class molecular chaperone
MTKNKIFVVVLLGLLIVLFTGCFSLGGGGGSGVPSGICSTCRGSGYTESWVQNSDGEVIFIKKTCSTCFGTGRY